MCCEFGLLNIWVGDSACKSILSFIGIIGIINYFDFFPNFKLDKRSKKWKGIFKWTRVWMFFWDKKLFFQINFFSLEMKKVPTNWCLLKFRSWMTQSAQNTVPILMQTKWFALESMRQLFFFTLQYLLLITNYNSSFVGL
jgi:hypothetical protein